MSTGRRTAVLYARVSTDERVQRGYSLRQQVEGCQQWAEAEGYAVLEVGQDPGQSRANPEEEVNGIIEGE